MFFAKSPGQIGQAARGLFCWATAYVAPGRACCAMGHGLWPRACLASQGRASAWAAGLRRVAGQAHHLGWPCAACGLGFVVGLACLDRLGLMQPWFIFFFANFIILFKMAKTCKIHNKSNKNHKMLNLVLLNSTQIVLHYEHIKSYGLVQNNCLKITLGFVVSN